MASTSAAVSGLDLGGRGKIGVLHEVACMVVSGVSETDVRERLKLRGYKLPVSVSC